MTGAVWAYRRTSLAACAHATVRWASCPLERVAALVPAAGRILDVGCGRGLLSLHLARQSRARAVLGVDVDPRALATARRTAGGAGLPASRVEFRQLSSGQLPQQIADARFEAVLLVDVLYLMPAPAQQRLLAACAGALAPGGVLLVKEMAPTPRWKFRWNLAQEILSVQLLGLTRGCGPMTFLEPAVLRTQLSRAGLSVEERSLDDGYLHPHHLLIGRRPRTGDPA